MKFFEYDYFKTKQDFTNDVKGVLNEMKALSKMKERSPASGDQVRAVDSALNRTIPKCADTSYPHLMLRLNYCVSLSSIHLTILCILRTIDPENYEEYTKDKC